MSDEYSAIFSHKRKITSVSDNSDKLCLARHLLRIELQEIVIENDEDLRSFVKP